MAPRVDPVQSSPELPSRVEVVVIGGGIIGTSTALFLAQKGIPVALCEKGHIAGEQSSRNWGFCRQQGRDPRELPLIIESLRIWRGIDRLVEGETGFRQAGVMYLANDEKSAAYNEKRLEHGRPYQLDTRIVSGRELADLLPGAARQWPSALYTASDGRAEPQMAAPAIARAVQRLGGAMLQGCAVRGLETAGGRVSAVVTEKGAIACNSVVLAGGAWSRLFCRSLRLTLPQLKVRASVLRTSPVKEAPELSIWAASGFATRKRLDGGYNLAHGSLSDVDIEPDNFRFFRTFWPAFRNERKGFHLHFGKRFFDELAQPARWPLDRESPFERVRVLDPRPSRSILDKAVANVRAAFPAFKEAQIEEDWAGYIDATPDAVPVISPVEQLPGFFIATGFSGHGFGIGPGAGRLMADLVSGAAPVVDPTPYRFSRFSDGSEITVITGF
ncbi:MAG TPA: FAD-binding oxidoreductase [Dongiaceae bacterium]|nr:FAD-binding oxidoreductase [Dongiaceae bacterium]